MVQAPGVRVAYTDAAVASMSWMNRRGVDLRDRRLPYSRDYDPDVSCWTTTSLQYPADRPAPVRRDGLFDPSLPFFEDWDYLIRLSARTPFHHARKVTSSTAISGEAASHPSGAPAERANSWREGPVLSKHARGSGRTSSPGRGHPAQRAGERGARTGRRRRGWPAERASFSRCDPIWRLGTGA